MYRIVCDYLDGRGRALDKMFDTEQEASDYAFDLNEKVAKFAHGGDIPFVYRVKECEKGAE